MTNLTNLSNKYLSGILLMLLLGCAPGLVFGHSNPPLSEEESSISADIEIKGVVTSAEDSSPLIGVTVLVKGTSTGAVTDIDGAYTLTAPEDATLVYSYLGFVDQEIAVNGRTSINIAMEVDAEQLEEVVVIGYGSQKKFSLNWICF